MDLISGKPYWPEQSSKKLKYPQLSQDLETDVVIIGGGISGALSAYLVSKTGKKCVILDKRYIASGSTSATTALLIYDLDIPLYALIKKIGKKRAVRTYKLSHSAIHQIDKIAKEIGAHGVLEHKKSFYFASTKQDVEIIKKEYKTRKKYGFKVSLLESEYLKKNYGVNADAAMVTHDGAQIDPFSFTRKLIDASVRLGTKAFRNTEVKSIKQKDGKNILYTSRGFTITAKHVIYAGGYEAVEFLKKVKGVEMTTDYVLMTKKMKDISCLRDYLAWETNKEYLYISTHENRIMAGISGSSYDYPKKRARSQKKKINKVISRFEKFFPNIKLEPEFIWSATFGNTKDSLPYIGEVKKYPNVYFDLAYGGNGIAFSMIAAKINRDKILGRKTPDDKIFRFDR